MDKLKELKTAIKEELDDAITDIFLKHQEELEIADGYISLANKILMDDLENKTVDLIIDVLITQINLGREEH